MMTAAATASTSLVVPDANIVSAILVGPRRPAEHLLDGHLIDAELDGLAHVQVTDRMPGSRAAEIEHDIRGCRVTSPVIPSSG